MNKKPALGRGLGALIPSQEEPSGTETGVLLCQVDLIHSNPNQPRKHFDEEALSSLAATIREKGILQPLLVRKQGERLELIAGERRLRAAKIAGLHEVPVIVREAGESDSLEISVLENIQREDLNPVEEARAYREMLEKLRLTQEELAKKMGKDRSSIANSVRLLQLPREILEDLASGELSAGHARALLALEHEILQLKIRALIKERGLSVRDTEKYVQQFKEGRPNPPPRLRRLDADTQRVEDELCRHYGTRVKIQKGRKGGKIQIAYASLDELNRIYSKMVDH